MKKLVFTEQSILAFIESLNEENFAKNDYYNSSNFITLNYDDFTIFLTTNKKDSNIENIPFIIVEPEILQETSKIEGIQTLFYTIHRTVVQVLQHKGTSFKSPSLIYTNGNKLVLKSYDIRHLFMTINTEHTNNFHVFKIADSRESIEDVKVDTTICKVIEPLRTDILKKYKIEIEKKEIKDFDYNYNLNTVYDSDEQNYFTFEQWVNKLSPRQTAFFNKNDKNSLKLIGPAGTGKTLVMELKAIDILKNRNPTARILFTCHSWAVACQVSDFIDTVAPEISNKIEIAPLLELAKEHVVLNNKEIVMLGNDSYEGKYGQIMLLSEVIQKFLRTDWIVYRNQCTPNFIEQLEDISFVNNNYTWEIMTEISCVIGANGIMPGKTSLTKYLKIKRYDSWMTHLSNDNEKEVIFRIYERYMKELFDSKNITSDQVINDYINYLSTYNWYYERTEKGYDYIFVDEMQLFNDQERMALVYLSRNSEEYPKIIMAMDPKQSVDEVYSDLGITEILNKSNPETDASMGNTKYFSLDIAYRYTKEILNFLKHIDASYPQLEVGHEWNNKISGLKSSKMKTGPLPCLYTFDSEKEEVKKAIQLAEEFSNRGQQTIILSLQEDLFSILQKETTDTNKFKQILSKREVALLKYTKKKILISEPNYVIGLQFDVVILIGCYSIYNKYDNNKSYYQRRFLSDLYLGASRAKSNLILTRNQNMADFPEFLDNAINNKLIMQN